MVATCYLLGVSTRRMDRLVQSPGITGLSKSQVSVMARDLDELVRDFRERPPDAGPYTFVAADALTMKVREGGRVVKIAVMVATGVNAGLVEAIGANLPGATWQRCRTHCTANLMSTCPKHAWGGVKAMLHSVFDQIDADAVHAQYDKLLTQVEHSPGRRGAGRAARRMGRRPPLPRADINARCPHRANLIEDNREEGIFYEISQDAVIRDTVHAAGCETV